MRISSAAIILLSISLVACSDGKRDAVPDADKLGLESAITAYCKDNSMGMSVKEFVSMTSPGGKTVVKCKMQEAGGLYNIAPVWTFEFTKEQSGAWKVVKHDN